MLPGAPRPRRLLVAAALSFCLAAALPCPEERRARSRSLPEGQKLAVRIVNGAGVDVSLLWVDFEGQEKHRMQLLPDEAIVHNTYPGHVFRFRATDSQTLLLDYEAPAGPPGGPVLVQPCGGMASASEVSQERWPELERLARDAAAPCEGPSRNWSCVRYVSPEEVEKRDKAKYGHHADEREGTRFQAGQTVDHHYDWQTGLMINVTSYEGGYLKMDMTDRLRQILYPWYEERKADSLSDAGDIPGGYSNAKQVAMDLINLDRFPDVKRAIAQEMKAVLEWWTGVRLSHSETFGVRIYRRGSMLVNHLDHPATHVASAVLQVGQRVDEDGGWPLELLHPHEAGRKEVYLQPGQMVLYEGARITHGRPMRLKGEEFGNIFVHFAPLGWDGVDKSRVNPHYQEREDLHRTEL